MIMDTETINYFKEQGYYTFRFYNTFPIELIGSRLITQNRYSCSCYALLCIVQNPHSEVCLTCNEVNNDITRVPYKLDVFDYAPDYKNKTLLII